MTTVGETTFTSREIDRFAALTLDRNPIHMDPRIAQRSFAGARVVHGMHVVLAALQHFAADRRQSLRFRRVRCQFPYPILIDEPVQFQYRRERDGGVRLSALVDEVPCAAVRLYDQAVREPEQGVAEPIRIDEQLDSISEPLDHEPRELATFAGTISNTRAAAVTDMFPDLCAIIGSSNVSALSRLSYIVGMLCPGLYSVFSSLDVTFTNNGAPKGFSKFAVEAVDERFRLVQIALLAGDLLGTFSAFQRPPAFQQPTFGSVSHRVRPREFAGSRTLVIGGSRGLGELTAKLLCSGGGCVHLTYSRGRSDAHRVSAEIMAANRGVCKPLELDILAPLSSDILRLLGNVDLVFYFPTPVIFRRKSKTFNATIFQDFMRFYVERFYLLCEAMESVAVRPVRIFYPSSIYVESRPKGMTEYAMAKAAGEVLISDLNAKSSNVHVISSRLPRMGSDQTNTIVSDAKEADSSAIILAIIRSMWPMESGNFSQAYSDR